MKILHIVAGDLSGGAARGAYWLHRGLIGLGVDSKILTNSKDTLGDSTVSSIVASKKEKLCNLIRSQLDSLPTILYSRRKRVIFSTSFVGYNFTDHPLYNWADVIHLHWINGGFVNIKHLSKVKKPIVWTMRDMWPMTGGCHYGMGCENYKSGCGKCKQLDSACRYDLSWLVAKRKQKHLPNGMKIVGISRWLSEKAGESKVFQGFDIRTIHNNISVNEFFPVDKAVAKKVLGIDTPKKIILTGAQSLKEFYKGFDRFMEAINKLNKSKYFLAFFGKLDDEVVKSIGFEYKNFGFLHDTVSLRLIYSSADVFVAPSLMDAFGKTLAESMACGTPVVCFDATGPKDIVDHQQNGYLAKPFEPDDLAKGIMWVLEDEERRKRLSKNARQKVEENFDIRIIAQKYKELYLKLLKK